MPFDAGSWFDSSFAGTRIPTADEALALMKCKVGVYLDVKDAEPDSIVALIARHDMFSSVIVYDDTASLVAMKQIEPRMLAMVPRIPEDPADMPALTERVRPSFFCSVVRRVTVEQIDACHDAGALLYMNTLGASADNPEGWTQALADGADGLETDRPVACLAFLREKGQTPILRTCGRRNSRIGSQSDGRSRRRATRVGGHRRRRDGMKTSPIDNDWLTEDEAIVYFKLDQLKGNAKERMRNLIRRKGLPYYELARGIRQYRRDELDAWREQQKRGPQIVNSARRRGP